MNSNKNNESAKKLLFDESKFKGVVIDAEKRSKLEMIFQLTEGLGKLKQNNPYTKYECMLLPYDSSHKHSGVTITFSNPVILYEGIVKSTISNLFSISDEVDVIPFGDDGARTRFIFLVKDLWKWKEKSNERYVGHHRWHCNI